MLALCRRVRGYMRYVVVKVLVLVGLACVLVLCCWRLLHCIVALSIHPGSRQVKGFTLKMGGEGPICVKLHMRMDLWDGASGRGWARKRVCRKTVLAHCYARP